MRNILKRTFSLLLALALCLSFLPIMTSASEEGTWVLVTDVSTLKAGDQLLIACNTAGVVASNISSNVMGKTTATFSSDKSTITTVPSDAVVLTLGGNQGAWTLSNSSGKLLGATAAKKVAWGSGMTTWSISISDGNATIQNGTSSYGRFLYNSSSPRFTTYTSNTSTSMLLPQLYRFEKTEVVDPECEHANTTTTTVDATCTEAGSTTVTCNDCGETVSTEVIEATGHNYVDGTCDKCSEAEPAAPAGYVLTDLAEIKSTDAVIITMSNGSKVWALSSANGTGSAPTAVVVTVKDDTITDEYANIYWNIVNDNGSLTIYPADDTTKWLYCTSTNNGVRVGSNTAKEFTVDASSGYLKHTGTGRYVGVYTTNPDWRCYTSNTTNIGGQTLAFYVLSSGSTEGGDTECTHANTTTTTVDATCTEAGSITVTCDDCGETVSTETIEALGHSYGEPNVTIPASCTTAGEQTKTCSVCNETVTETIPATGHNYVDGICSVCGEKEPLITTATIDFATTAQRVSQDATTQVWQNAGLSLTNNKAGSSSDIIDSSNPVRFYKNSEIVMEYPGMTKIEFACNTAAYATALGDSISDSSVSVTVDDKLVTIVPQMAIDSYTITLSAGQVRVDSVTVYAEKSECAHTNTTTTTVNATCTEAGSITVTCDDCGATVGVEEIPAAGHTEGEGVVTAPTCTEEGYTTYTCTVCGATRTDNPVAATGHSYVDGTCSSCGAAEPDYSGDYYIATIRTSGNYWYMTNDLGTASTKRYQAEDTGVTELPATIENATGDKIFTLVKLENNTYVIKTYTAEGEAQYLSHTGTSNSGLLTDREGALAVTVDVTADGLFNIHYAAEDEERYLSLNRTTDSDYFAWYKNTQIYDLALISVAACVHEDANGNNACDACHKPIVAQVGDKVFTDVSEAVAAIPANGYLKLTGDVTADVTLTQNTYLDLAGYNWNGTITTGEYTLYGMDSSTDDYDCTDGNGNNNYGTVKVDGNVELQHKTSVTGKVRRYLTYTDENGAVSFHRIYVGITSMNLRPGVKGVGYKAAFRADEVAQSMLNTADAYGFKLWVEGFEGTPVSASKDLESFMNSGYVTLRLQNFDMEHFGDKNVYATVYLKLANGTVIESATYEYTLNEMLVEINKSLSSYTPAQQDAIKAWCQQYADYLAGALGEGNYENLIAE